jgi:octaprenyl-diphosphate synthase
MQSLVKREGAKKTFCAFSAVSEALEQVKVHIEHQMSLCGEPVRGLAGHIAFGRGKMIRPGLVLLSGGAFGKITEAHIREAAIVEMIHNATLLHDDVVDEGKSRRGMPTLNALEGNESAVLLGDFILSKVFKMCMGLERRAAEEITEATEQTCVGELKQIAQRGNCELSEEEYIEIIAEKTASFFSLACRIGAMESGADAGEIRAMSEYGRCTGIAFQITDDLLDLTGEQASIGKEVGNDLDRDKLTLPVIHLLETAGEKQRKEAVKVLFGRGRQTAAEAAARAKVLAKLRGNGCLAYAKRRAKEFVEQAVGEIAGISQSRYKKALTETARFIVERTA